MARVISIISLGKGSGKTTVALNLGLALHKLNNRVLVFDTDFTHNNMLEHLELHNLPVNILHVMNGEAHVNDSIYKHITGLRLIPSVVHKYDDMSYIQDLLVDYDYLILDTPKEPEYLDIVLKNSDEAIIVHNPKYSAKIVRDAIDMIYAHRLSNLGIVLNEAMEDSVDDIFEIPVIMKLQTDKDIAESFKMKNPVVHTHPKSNASKKFHTLARKLS